MEQLQSAIKYVVIVVGVIAAMLLGDYFGHKFGRMKLVWTGIVAALLADHCVRGLCRSCSAELNR